MLRVTPDEWHAGRRVQERYGVALDDALKHRLVREIRRAERALRGPKKNGRGQGVLAAYEISQQAGNRARWVVTLDGVAFHLIYDTQERIIITFLPPYGGLKK